MSKHKLKMATKDDKVNKKVECFQLRIYPTKEQSYTISQYIDSVNGVYNFLLRSYIDDRNESILNRIKELKEEDVFEYNEDGSIKKTKSCILKYSDKIIEHLCIQNDIELVYKNKKIKNKETGIWEDKQFLDSSALRKKLLEKNPKIKIIDYPELKSYIEIFNVSDESYNHYKSISSIALNQGYLDLKTALNNWKKGKASFPVFKKRAKIRDEYGNVLEDRISGTTTIFSRNWYYEDICNKDDINNKYINLFIDKRIGFIKLRLHRPIPENYLVSTYAKIIKTIDKKYYINFVVYRDEEDNKDNIKIENSLGIDLSLSDDFLFIDSNGNKIGNIAYSEEIQRMENHIKSLQKELDNKTISSKNYYKIIDRINSLTAKIDRNKKYELQKIARNLVKEYDILCMEDLDVSSMKKKPRIVEDSIPVTKKDLDECLKYHQSDLKNPEFLKKLEFKSDLRKKLQKVDLGLLIQYIESESNKQYKKFIKVNRYYPSSQICSCCGVQNKNYSGLNNLSKRVFICEECGNELDRDVNAAKNILTEGLRIYKEK